MKQRWLGGFHSVSVSIGVHLWFPNESIRLSSSLLRADTPRRSRLRQASARQVAPPRLIPIHAVGNRGLRGSNRIFQGQDQPRANRTNDAPDGVYWIGSSFIFNASIRAHPCHPRKFQTELLPLNRGSQSRAVKIPAIMPELGSVGKIRNDLSFETVGGALRPDGRCNSRF